MKKGTLVADLVFNGDVVAQIDSKVSKRLSNISSEYILVVYAASWCPKWIDEIM